MKLKTRAVGNLKQEKDFYEVRANIANLLQTMILFAARVLQSAFDKNDLPKLEEELSRLFRTNAFNMAQRKQYEEQKFKKFPVCISG